MCLHFETVTAKNRGAVERLALLPEQAGFIESPAECLREADASDFWRPVGIYDGTELVGFAMYGYLPFLGEGQLWFDRLLIDKAFQGRGYAKAAIAALLDTDKLRASKNQEADIKTALLFLNHHSFHAFAGNPEFFYFWVDFCSGIGYTFIGREPCVEPAVFR